VKDDVMSKKNFEDLIKAFTAPPLPEGFEITPIEWGNIGPSKVKYKNKIYDVCCFDLKTKEVDIDLNPGKMWVTISPEEYKVIE
jgi:hypothetical protein